MASPGACAAADAGSRGEHILEALSLPEGPGAAAAAAAAATQEPPGVPCIFCEERAPAAEQAQLLKHMILEHKLVIADVRLIADFKWYALYWKRRFSEQPITDFCSVIRTNSEAALEEQENYFLLCDVLPEDRILREQLQQKRLKEMLEQQQKERLDTSFQRVCLFCQEECTGNRAVLYNHMNKEHGFNVGLPDNIVYCNEFLDALQKKLDSLQCLYCERLFRDKNTLKDHMRKKQHRKINAKNGEYDRFYIINYLEFGKSWEEVQSEDDRELLDNQDDDWSDWEEHPASAVCLFCESQADTTDKMLIHMKDIHGFDLLEMKSDLGLKFYQQVKLVNFIRREIHMFRCHFCQQKFLSKSDLVAHMEESKHIGLLPDKVAWDQPQYYFPTYENDTLLCTLTDSDGELSAEDRNEDIPVIAEDISDLQNLKQSSVLNQLLQEEAFRQ